MHGDASDDGSGDGADASVGVRAPVPAAAWYALAVLSIANVLNYIDRQIPAILAENIKADLRLTDAQLGFLFGTTFVILFAVFGVSMGRVADGVSRTRMMALGLAFWSIMTTVSGFASHFVHLVLARVGVGLGEATATPCSVSLLVESFPRRLRATALGIYLVGTSLGGGLALMIGGFVLDRWPALCRAAPPAIGLCGLAGWQGAFLVVGIPGLVTALLILFIREPKVARIDRGPLAGFIGGQLATAVPPFTLVSALRHGGRGAAGRNVVAVVLLTALVLALGTALGDWGQWAGVAIGVYSIFSWGQNLKVKDPPLFHLTLGCPTFLIAVSGMAIAGCLNNSVHFWSVPYAIRHFGMSASEAGLVLGGAICVASAFGVSLGGIITDRWKQRDPRAPIWMTLIGLLGPIPSLILMFGVSDRESYILGIALHALIGMCWAGGATAFFQDLVLPRMRGATASAFAMLVILFSLAVGPYTTGKISTLTGSLSAGILGLHLLMPISVVLLIWAARRVLNETPARRMAIAKRHGEADGAMALG